jgi:hypothetical protein
MLKEFGTRYDQSGECNLEQPAGLRQEQRPNRDLSILETPFEPSLCFMLRDFLDDDTRTIVPE